MSAGIIVGIVLGSIILLILLAFVIWFWANFRTLVKMRGFVDKGFEELNENLKKRYELLPKYIEAVKTSVDYDFSKILDARGASMASRNIDEQLKNDSALSNEVVNLYQLINENGKLNENVDFLDIRNEMSAIEDEIDYCRKYYNGVAKLYNAKCTVFPANMVAKWFHLEKCSLYV
ncbi:MAG: LemA family protein [Clostridia bacterium]|nr:LemA family protein [Clostridia bacterium]